MHIKKNNQKTQKTFGKKRKLLNKYNMHNKLFTFYADHDQDTLNIFYFHFTKIKSRKGSTKNVNIQPN